MTTADQGDKLEQKDALLPCPFCGSDPGVYYAGKMVMCIKPDCALHHLPFTPEKWNTRAMSSAVAPALEALIPLVEEMIGCLDPKMVEAHDSGGLAALGIKHSDEGCSLCKARRIVGEAKKTTLRQASEREEEQRDADPA